MEWRRYGLNGMDIRAIKKQAANENQARKFGTELSSNINILNNQKNNRKNKKIEINNRKRTFRQLNEEYQEFKEEEPDPPTKRFRYNLRSRQTRAQTQVNERENKNKNKHNNKKKMDIDSTDEDIDLFHNNNNNKKKVKKNRKQFPVRRSLRLKNKRIKNKQTIKIITDETIANLECDLENKDNEIYVTEYINDIIAWYYKCEQEQKEQKLIKSNYICNKTIQNDLNESMRIILLNWLLNVHRRFKLLDRTFFLGIYIFDAYLSLVRIKREELQLIGCASIWIASKYNEIYAPEANDFAYISDYSFNIEKLFKAEIEILCKLKFKFANIITPLHFVERYLQIATYPIHKKYKQRGTIKAIHDSKMYINLLKHLTYFFIELSLFDCKLISTQKPSIIAAASLCFAMLSISLYSQWPAFLKKGTGYLYKDLKPILKRLNQLKILSDKKKITAVAKKHQSIKKWLDKLNVDAVINNKD